MELNTLIRICEGEHAGQVGTICYNWLDGKGGIWGEHSFKMPEGGFGPELAKPDFIFRNVDMQGRVGDGAECVGEYNYEVVTQAREEK